MMGLEDFKFYLFLLPNCPSSLESLAHTEYLALHLWMDFEHRDSLHGLVSQYRSGYMTQAGQPGCDFPVCFHSSALPWLYYSCVKNEAPASLTMSPEQPAQDP